MGESSATRIVRRRYRAVPPQGLGGGIRFLSACRFRCRRARARARPFGSRRRSGGQRISADRKSARSPPTRAVLIRARARFHAHTCSPEEETAEEGRVCTPTYAQRRARGRYCGHRFLAIAKLRQPKVKLDFSGDTRGDSRPRPPRGARPTRFGT